VSFSFSYSFHSVLYHFFSLAVDPTEKRPSLNNSLGCLLLRCLEVNVLLLHSTILRERDCRAVARQRVQMPQYNRLVRSKLEYVSVVWNSVTSTNTNKLERMQQRFEAPCFNRIFPDAHCLYSLALEELKLYILRMRRHRLDALFFTQVYLTFKSFLFWKLLAFEFLLGIPETLLV
jgi:hypothetical protein